VTSMRKNKGLTSRLGRVLQTARDCFPHSEGKQPELNRLACGGVWIDVGAHLGTATFEVAQSNPALHVYAFEPNLKLAAQCWGVLPNFTVLPIAIAENDGFAEFHINANAGASSLLPFNPEGLQKWIGGHLLKVESKVKVPTIRLDSFMNAVGIASVEYLKVDAQGGDLSVIKSAGERIRDIKRIMLEVAVTSVSLYEGAATRTDVVTYLQRFGFTLKEVEAQTHGQEENLTFLLEPST
jgi:FkbM family methyltransferase